MIYDVVIVGGGIAGFPISILTGKLAADEARKRLK